MDSYRVQYPRSPLQNMPRANTYSPPPSIISPKAETNYSPGFSVPGQSPMSSPPVRSPTEMPQALIADLSSPTPVTRPKTFAQWVAMAKENTLEVRRNGSPSPLVWILVEGTDIPANAIVGGEDRRKPLYIARCFYEGGIYIGKAGRHLKLGAAIPYNGREIEVSTYEVLMPALQAVRYSVIDSPPILEIPRMVQDFNMNNNNDRLSLAPSVPKVENNSLQRLNEIEVVILVDDSASMYGPLWADAREALAGVADLAAEYGSDGVDVYFLNDTHSGMAMKDSQSVKKLFDSVIPEGQTPTGQKLEEIMNKYIPHIENRTFPNKPLTIIVITDGVPTDDPKEVIINAARRLDSNQVPENMLGIQFAQIGDDLDATEALDELDSGIAAINGIRDMVDTTPCHPGDPQFTTDTVVKILLGAINGQVGGVPAGPPSLPRPGNIHH